MKHSSKAILVFAQSASRDASDKLLPGGECVFEYLTRQTIQKARRTGFPVFHFDQGMQEGSTFGERLSRAVSSLFDVGYESLVVIGNDSPGLSTATLNAAFSSLDPKNAVLGPASDGGVYLIGLHRDHFDFQSFLDLPWRQGRLFQDMISWLYSRGSENIEVLKCEMDLDTSGDFKNLSRNSGFSDQRLLRLIAGLFYTGPAEDSLKSLIFSLGFYPYIQFNKGSPRLFSI